MAFQDLYRMSSHAVISNHQNEILLLKANYGDCAWGLPGGGLDVGETIHQALMRECKEELGCEIEILYLSGAYYHASVHSHAFIFRCQLKTNQDIQLSAEHSAYGWFQLQDLTAVQKIRVQDCFAFDGTVLSRSF
ncbi:NUDIX hydrolase [Acinetobacter sp. MD2(2019)]|uniref:NUDIX hydrolase n=1 Tax=Acinetobacter sp. MD2(2019) TaxID=2605273 RepID=UPI002D1EE53B|nr:NUDIX domain-containing protein [Acinetobacter sp. MD2(2019)]MEB3753690.1 NUDIX domain-containing protein [Acinetobacter sp. MD2(2019)]